MKVSANIATQQSRRHVLPKMLDSIVDQFDIIRVYCNDYEADSALEREFGNAHFYSAQDYTDRAKFLWNSKDEYYFTMDDDIKYPEWYVPRTLQHIKEDPSRIYTYHGRKLLGKDRNYYFGHQVYHFLRQVKEGIPVDVPGTGVMAFDSSAIGLDIMQYKDDCMADLLVALEAAKKEIPITCLGHEMHDFRSLIHHNDPSICNSHKWDCDRQSELADQIFLFNNPI